MQPTPGPIGHENEVTPASVEVGTKLTAIAPLDDDFAEGIDIETEEDAE